MTLQKGICEECKKEYEYEYNPKYPRKYCHECSAKKKAEYSGASPEQNVPVVKPGMPVNIGKSSEGMPVPNRNTTMYVSYAKDIFCAIYDRDKASTGDYMQAAIELVKQAQKEFS